MEKKEAAPPLEQNQQTAPLPAPEPEENAKKNNLETPAMATTPRTETRQATEEPAKAIIAEIQKIGAKVDSLENQVKLLKQQRRQGTRRA